MAYQFWLDELSLLAEGTRVQRVREFNRFLRYVGMDAEALYALHKGYLEGGDPRNSRVVPRMVAQCAQRMVDEGYAPGTARNMAHAVVSFMQAQSLAFPLRLRDLPPVSFRGRDVVPAEVMREWYHICHGMWFTHRNQALIMVSKDTGLRASDVARISVEDVLTGEARDENGSVFRVFRPFTTKKTGGVAYIHWGPEAEDAVQRYLDGRVAGPLFIDAMGKRLSAYSIVNLFQRLAARTEKGRHSHHSMRKFHRTALEAVMPESYVKKLQGKATDPYIHPEQTGELTRAYIKNYDALRVFRDAHDYEELQRSLEEERQERSDMERRIRDLELRVRWEELERKHRR